MRAKLEEKKKGVMGCPLKKNLKRSLSQVCNHGKGVSFIARPRANAQCTVSLIFPKYIPIPIYVHASKYELEYVHLKGEIRKL